MGAIFKEVGRANHPWIKLWYGGKKVLINKMFDLTLKENNKKTREALRKPGKLSFPLEILWNCLRQNILLRDHRSCGKNDPEVIFLILEIS